MTSIHDRIHRRSVLQQLTRVFERSEALSGRTLPIRKTGFGIWAATPVRVVAEAALTLAELGLLDQRQQTGHVIDAGTGDGRIPAVLALFDPSRVVYGIEADSTLHARAVTNLQMLDARGVIDATHVRLLEADYCDVATYETHGIALHQTGVIFNYPDGNQGRLARFVAQHCGHDTALCLLTHNRTMEIDELELHACHDVADGTGPPWQLSLYRRPSSGAIEC